MRSEEYKAQKKIQKGEQRELERMVSQTGLRGTSRKMAEQYGRGALDGMRIAYTAVAQRLKRAGNSRDEIAAFFRDLMSEEELERLMNELDQRPDRG